MDCDRLTEMESAVVSITLLTTAEGGRRKPAFDSPRFRPSIVVGDAAQREAIKDADGVIREHYIDTPFSGNGQVLRLGGTYEVTLQLWNPEADLSAVVPGATFTLREGPKIIGYGHVIERTQTME